MRITISVPKPCHEDWSAMTPREQGRHCAQCDHVVADLTRTTDAQLVALFTSDARPKCARFDARQLDRVLGAAEQPRAGALPLAAFSSLVAVAAGHQAIAQGGPVVRPMVKLGEAAISRPAPPPPVVVGKIMAVPHSIPPVCAGTITGDSIAHPVADPILERIETGNVSITMEGMVRDQLPPVPPEIDSAATALNTPDGQGTSGEDDIPIGDPAHGDGPLGIKGFVEDVGTGKMLPGAIVQLRGTDVRVRCNDRGYFGLQVPEDMPRHTLVLDILVPGTGSMSLPLPAEGTPFFAPIKFVPETPAAIEAIDTLDLSPLVIERERMRTTAGICVVRCQQPRPGLWQRMVAPFKRGWYQVWH